MVEVPLAVELVATTDERTRIGSLHGFSPAVLLARARHENFPVALRLLPRRLREDLLAVYGFARLVDQIGDEAPGDRRALLDALECDLAAAFAGRAEHPLLQRLTPLIRRHRLPREPFVRLIEANRFDQGPVALPSFEALLGYCALSANPVGELVLALFGAATPGHIALSDHVCSALQIVEHCQDVAEDHAAGRVYLPARDLEALGCTAEELARAPASEPLRRVVALQVERSRRLLRSGDALVASLEGAARFVVAGFVAGGRATCDALQAAAFDPTSAPVRPRRSRTLRHGVRILAGKGR